MVGPQSASLSGEASIELRRILEYVDYPATPDDVPSAAVTGHLHPAAIQPLRHRSGRSYDGESAIRRELGL